MVCDIAALKQGGWFLASVAAAIWLYGMADVFFVLESNLIDGTPILAFGSPV